MKRIAILLFSVLFLFSLASCANSGVKSDSDAPLPAGENFDNVPELILNGNSLDVYTSHYYLEKDRVFIPLDAFLKSLGAEFADSPLNTSETEVYSFMEKNYVVADSLHLFMLEDDYIKLTEDFLEENKALTAEAVKNTGLLPKSSSKFSPPESWLEYGIWSDHISLMNALKNSGIDITIEYDYENRTIDVTLPH